MAPDIRASDNAGSQQSVAPQPAAVDVAGAAQIATVNGIIDTANHDTE